LYDNKIINKKQFKDLNIYLIISHNMPKINIDYSKTVIYKIVCNDENVNYIYVGSTTNFTKRKCDHKNRCNNINGKEYNHKKYVHIRENGGWENFKMIEVEKYPCNDKREAEAREEVIRFSILPEAIKANMNNYMKYMKYIYYYTS
jgi:predicted GIY-YIG superfamily endonuclease